MWTLLPLFGAAVAADCDPAERARLAEEANRLASRNAWAGVERAYEELEGTGCPLPLPDLFLGAQAARHLGRTYEVWQRLRAAQAMGAASEVSDEIAAIEEGYGRVHLDGDARRRPVLSREAMPFAPDARSSIEWAQRVVAETGSFDGLLPVGDYVVGTTPFQVAASMEPMQVEVGRVRGEASAKPSLVHWSGPVGRVGGQFLSSPAPAEAIVGDAGAISFPPETLHLFGPGAQLGAELGFGYAAPEWGLAATVGYGGGYGRHTLHGGHAGLAAVLRPGDLRFAVGPSWGVWGGKGTGVGALPDLGPDSNLPDPSTIRYEGLSWGPGVTGSAGFGFIEWGDHLQGGIELGGSWHTDGDRSFTEIGLGFAIAPVVPRFRG